MSPSTGTDESQSSRFIEKGVGATPAGGAHGCSPDPTPSALFSLSLHTLSRPKAIVLLEVSPHLALSTDVGFKSDSLLYALRKQHTQEATFTAPGLRHIQRWL